MPTYEYKCTQDGSRFELWQEVGSAAPPCPTCGAPTKKVFQAPRIIFKGSGFYVTDLRSEQSGGKSEESGAKTESASSTPAPSTSSETKTEAAPASTSSTAITGASTAKSE